MFTSTCPTCGREKVYKSKKTRDQFIAKNCISCSNSINNGGLGYSIICVCGRKKENPRAKCRHCVNERRKIHHHAIYRYKKYGKTKEWFDALFGLGCGICTSTFSVASDAHIDHSHTTNEARGLLCGNCNRGLGIFKDSPDRLRSAAAYLERTTHGS